MRVGRKAVNAPSFGADVPKAAPEVEPTVAIQPTADSMFARMRSGAIDVGAYLNHKVEEATSHLRGLAPGERSFIQEVLRGHLETDLADLVQIATT